MTVPPQGVGRYLMPSAPALPASFSTLRMGCLAQHGPPSPILHHCCLSGGWVNFTGLACTGGGEEALLCHPSPFPYFLTAHEASLVNQTHTCIKGGGVTT